MSRLLLILLLLAPGTAQAAADFSKGGIGTTGSEFLNLDVGARGIALGGAHTASTNDAYSLYWNPAGLAKIPSLSLGFQYTRYVEDVSHQSMMFGRRLNDTSVIGAGVRYVDYGRITQTDINDVDKAKFTPRSYVAEVGWGQSIYDLSDSEVDVDIGVAARYLRSDFIEEADGFGADLGIQSRFYRGTRSYDLAFVIQNMGRGQKFDRERDSLPLRAKLGGAFSPVRSLQLSADAVMPVNNLPYGAFGAEYMVEASNTLKLALRGGINTLTLSSLDAPALFNFGFGLTFVDLTMDYAFSPLGELGNQIHRVSISFNLPAKLSRRHRER